MNINEIAPGKRVVVNELYEDLNWLLSEDQLVGRQTGIHAIVVGELVNSGHQIWWLEYNGQRALYRYDEFSEEKVPLYRLRWLPC